MGRSVPFRIDIADEVLDDLRRRLRATRWPDAQTGPGWSQGVPLDRVRELCRHWADGYDWRATEAGLNALPQYRTEVDGLWIHHLHVRSPDPDAIPLVMTHGWPGSVMEFRKVIGALTEPAGDGPAFHVVCPSLPGYGFSDKPTSPGWGVERIGRAWVELMAGLGYERFAAQGHDWGTSVSTAIAQQDPDRVIGLHLVPPLAAPDPATFDDLTDAERRSLADLERAGQVEDGYSLEQSTRPQTVGYGLVDSPAALCAWIVEKFRAWTDWEHRTFTDDDLLDNLMLYWLPGTGASSARLYWESFKAVQQRFAGETTDEVSVPVGGTVFPKEIPRPSRRWAARRFTDLRYWSEPGLGGHFAAFEQPELFVAEVRACFRALTA
ncbi:epoxide hydrolase family protein [Dactylosporangium cerinum]|uniref:Epoxide hydrolase family protein n=1 Tax=Dactylosporangium cerinum TaxID=1434730 RepID=A0ABV9W8L0_9ACTN